MALLGVDIGTSELKATLFAEDGADLALECAEYQPNHSSDGRAELPADLLWAMLRDTIRRIAVSAKGHRIRAVAFSCHGESFVPVAADGSALRPFLLNIDSRAAQEMEQLERSFGREHLYQVTGLPPHPMYTLPKIEWLRRNEPSVFSSTARFLCVEDFIFSRAGAGEAIDFSLASRILALDVTKGKWCAELLQRVGITPDHLSPLFPGGSAIGTAAPSVAEELGIPADAIWTTGGHDQACCSLGAGGLASGTVVDGTGTFECISFAGKSPLLSAPAMKANLPCGRHTAPGRFLTLSYAPGGIVLKWLRDQFGRDVLSVAGATHRSAYDLLLANVPYEPTGIFVFPYLLGTGTPWLDASAKAAVSGFTYTTSREAFVKAALEGVTYEMRLNLEILESLGVPVQRIIAVGGGAKSGVWLQLKADIFGREVVVVPGEASCRGAAICAGVGSGAYQSFEEATAAAIRPGLVYEPRPRIHSRYSELFEKYKDLARRLYGHELPAPSRD